MRRTALLTIAATSAALLTTITTGHAAEPPTCQGVPATIHGPPGTYLQGTDGDDVIVMGEGNHDPDDYRPAQAGAGDDLICLIAPVFIDAGEGNDSVLVSFDDDPAEDHDMSRVDLGPGVDRYASSGTGANYVTSEHPREANADNITFGPGDGHLQFRGIQTAPGQIVGAFTGHFSVQTRSDWEIDNRTGTFTVNDTLDNQLPGVNRWDMGFWGPGGSLDFQGNDSDEYVDISVADHWKRTVDLGGGDDVLVTRRPAGNGNGSRMDGGSGSDELRLWNPFGTTSLDLARGTLHSSRGTGRAGLRNERVVRVVNFEHAALASVDTVVKGTNRANRITVASCRARVEARGGNDVVDASPTRLEARSGKDVVDAWPDEFETQFWRPDYCRGYRDGFELGATIDGGPGNDQIRGGKYGDVLVGGPGRDVVDGLRGRDTCRAEVRRRCER